MGLQAKSHDILALGPGTCTLVRGFALRGAKAIGIDPDLRLLAEAKKLDSLVGVTIIYRVGKAEAIPLSYCSSDIITAGQCWHWFDELVVAQEIARVARPGEKVAIAHFDWLPISESLVEATEKLILRRNPT